MDLRTKLVFGLVAVSLLSMLALGTLAYTSARTLIVRRSELSLVSLAESKADQVAAVVTGWEEAVALLASRTQLRSSLAVWNATRSDAERPRISRILDDARTSSAIVEGLAIHGVDGQLVAHTGAIDTTPIAAGSSDRVGPPRFQGYIDGDPPRVAYRSGLHLDGRPVGTLRAVLSTRDLADVALQRTGLGETGETLVATLAPDGTVRLLTPLRHRAAGGTGVAPRAEAMIRDAFNAAAGPLPASVIDYRGEPVWIAAHRIAAADLDLIVKFDEAEELADITALRGRIIGVGFSIASFAILLGVAMGFAFARPILQLSATAGRIRDGDLSARADADRDDELGFLAVTFNEMSAELERRLAQLQEYKTFFDQSRDMLCIAGTDGFFKRVNPAFTRTLGWSEEELLGRPFIDFVHPDDVEATIRETRKLARGVPTVSFVNRYRCSDGTFRTLRWSSHPDPDTGYIYAAARSLDDQGRPAPSP